MRSKVHFSWSSTYRFGLTLAELLIIMGIIAMLAGIGWMATEPIRQKALLTVCRSNFQQIYLAVQQYREDYEGIEPDGRPLSRTDVGLPPDNLTAGLVRGGYIKKGDPILHCPIGEKILRAQLAQFEWGKYITLGSSYEYPANLPLCIHNPLKPFADHFSQCVAQKRSQVAILGDRWHNPPKPPEAPPIPTPLFPQWELVLRLDGQIDWVLVTDGKACR